MPAPHRRNKGESLAHAINHQNSARGVADDGDRLVATRIRKDKQWEEAAARLSPALRKVAEEVKSSDLAERAEQARLEYQRGTQYFHYTTAVKQGRAKPPTVVLTPGKHPRYWLGHCLAPKCDREIWVDSPKPRLPFCGPVCSEKYRSKHA